MKNFLWSYENQYFLAEVCSNLTVLWFQWRLLFWKRPTRKYQAHWDQLTDMLTKQRWPPGWRSTTFATSFGDEYCNNLKYVMFTSRLPVILFSFFISIPSSCGFTLASLYHSHCCFPLENFTWLVTHVRGEPERQGKLQETSLQSVWTSRARGEGCWMRRMEKTIWQDSCLNRMLIWGQLTNKCRY